jgi:hypothetical protein
MNALLKQKLNGMLGTSQVFKLMSESDQSNLLISFENASDDQLAQAISILEAREKQFLDNEKVRLEAAQAQIIAAEKLHEEIKATEKLVLEVDEEEDQQNSIKELEKIEAEMATSVQSDPSAKSKKFLGLF